MTYFLKMKKRVKKWMNSEKYISIPRSNHTWGLILFVFILIQSNIIILDLVWFISTSRKTGFILYSNFWTQLYHLGSQTWGTQCKIASLSMQSYIASPENRNKGKGNGAGLAWESQSHCFADKFGTPYTHSFGTDTPHDYSQGNWRTMLSIIIKLE